MTQNTSIIKRYKNILLCSMLISVLLCCSCVVQEHIIIHPNGSGSLELVVALDPALIQYIVDVGEASGAFWETYGPALSWTGSLLGGRAGLSFGQTNISLFAKRIWLLRARHCHYVSLRHLLETHHSRGRTSQWSAYDSIFFGSGNHLSGHALFNPNHLCILGLYDRRSNCKPLYQTKTRGRNKIFDLAADAGIEGHEYKITLKWTASGDDGNSGRADHYLIYYGKTRITESNLEEFSLIPV